MRGAGGYFTVSDPDGRSFNGLTEMDTVTCQHCGKLLRLEPKERPEDKYGLCFSCRDDRRPLSGIICTECKKKTGCLPLEAMLERMENRQRMLECR